MQVSVEKTSELSRKMTVSISDAVVQEKMETRFRRLAREVKVDGFRPGKVPANIVKKLYSDKVRSEVTGDLIQSSYFEALQQQNLVPAGNPFIQTSDESENFQYIAEFEVYPEISLDGINELAIVRPVASVEETDVDNMIEKLRQQKKTWAAADRVSASGDLVAITFSGVSEGENFTDGTIQDFKVEIGAGKMVPGFEDELTGLAAGEAKTFTLTFPEKYNNEKLAGKLAEFSVEVVKVEQAVLPELDEEFIKAYGVEDGELNTFRADVKANMQRELVHGLKNRLKTAVMDALFEKVAISTPKALIDEEIQALLKPYTERANKLKLKLEDLQLPRDMFENQAKRRVALGLILGEIIKKNEIRVDPSRVREVIEDMAKSYETPEDVINWYYADQERLKDVQQMVLEDQAVDWVVSQAIISDATMSFSDVMEKSVSEA